MYILRRNFNSGVFLVLRLSSQKIFNMSTLRGLFSEIIIRLNTVYDNWF